LLFFNLIIIGLQVKKQNTNDERGRNRERERKRVNKWMRKNLLLHQGHFFSQELYLMWHKNKREKKK
jgi:hypothetical protein